MADPLCEIRTYAKFAPMQSHIWQIVIAIRGKLCKPYLANRSVQL